MKVFLDANVLVAVINKEYPLFTHAARIMSLPARDFDLVTSPICIAIACYFAEKKTGAQAARQKMQLLINNIGITVIDKTVVKDAFADKKVLDVEDGLEYYAAVKYGCDCIITENRDDFYFSKLEVLSCINFFEKYLLKK
jgi:predicted nucleic acid-binding protein